MKNVSRLIITFHNRFLSIETHQLEATTGKEQTTSWSHTRLLVPSLNVFLSEIRNHCYFNGVTTRGSSIAETIIVDPAQLQSTFIRRFLDWMYNNDFSGAATSSNDAVGKRWLGVFERKTHFKLFSWQKIR